MDDSVGLSWPPDAAAKKVLKEVERYLAGGSDPEYREAMAKVVPDGKPIYGVRVPALRSLAKSLFETYGRSPELIQPIAEEAWSRNQREQQLLGLFLLNGIRLSSKVRWVLGVRFLPDVSNWETCDQLCMALLGRALAEDPSYMDVLEQWISDPNLWVRRAALVAPVYLRRAKFADAQAADLDRRTLKICEALLPDKEKYIRKAVDWSIRAVIGRRYGLAQAWMFKVIQKGLPRHAFSTLKLASKKLTPEDREAFLHRLARAVA